jgi:hypothetical protein
MRRKYEEKRAWVLNRLQAQYEYSCRVHNPPDRPWISATDQDEQEAWHAEFGGKEVIYTMGPNVSPDFARTLRRMYADGDLVRVTNGNQDARSWGQKTYYVAYSFKDWPPPRENPPHLLSEEWFKRALLRLPRKAKA